jgi:hypothetical protein
MPLLEGEDDPLGVEDLATHRLPLEQAPHAYAIFQKKGEGRSRSRFNHERARLRPVPRASSSRGHSK